MLRPQPWLVLGCALSREAVRAYIVFRRTLPPRLVRRNSTQSPYVCISTAWDKSRVSRSTKVTFNIMQGWEAVRHARLPSDSHQHHSAGKKSCHSYREPMRRRVVEVHTHMQSYGLHGGVLYCICICIKSKSVMSQHHGGFIC
jgi:hypothetical protein